MPNVTPKPIYSIAQTFLTALGGDKTRFTFQTFDDRKTTRPELAQTFSSTLDEVFKKLTRLNFDGAGVFVTINETDLQGRKKANIKGIRALFIDCDESLPQAFHLEPSIIVRSSGSKGHAYWLLDDTSPELERFEPAQMRLAQHYSSDPAVKDIGRVMRLPGFLHMKNEPALVEVMKMNELRYTLEEVLEGLPKLPSTTKSTAKPSSKPNTAKMKSPTAPISEVEAKLQEQLKLVMNAKEGTRDNTLNRAAFIVGQLLSQGLDEEQVSRQLKAAATLNGLDDAAIDKCIRSGLSAGKLEPFTETPKSKHKQLLSLIRENYADRLKWDVMKLLPILDGETVSMSAVEYNLVDNYDIDVNYDKMCRIVYKLAKDKPYNPVTAYLNKVAQEVTPSSDILDRLTSEAMGLENALERRYVLRWLIGAVARAMEPGCKMDTALILQGGQGYRKTTFFQSLFGIDNFMTFGEGTNERDDLVKMYKNWAVEWGEFEVAASRKGVSEMKNFMTRQRDEIRLPYAADTEEYLRHFVLCGSTNKDEFLFDETGNRRFWVCRIPRPIDIDWVATHRDEIWSAAYALYAQHEQWWLTDREQAMSNEANTTYEAESPWEQLVSSWLTGRHVADGGIPYRNNPFTTADILLNAIGKPAGNWGRKDEMDVAKVMKRLGYESKQQRIGKTKARYWESAQPLQAEPVPTSLHF